MSVIIYFWYCQYLYGPFIHWKDGSYIGALVIHQSRPSEPALLCMITPMYEPFLRCMKGTLIY